MVRTPWLLATLLFASVMILVIMGPIEVLVPFLIKDRLGGGPGDHAMVLAAFGIGGALGSLAMASLPDAAALPDGDEPHVGRRLRPARGDRAAPNEIWMVVVASFVLGVLFSAPMVIWGTLLQRRVPPALLGRVRRSTSSSRSASCRSRWRSPGRSSDAIGLRTTFLIAGIVPGVVAVVAIVLGQAARRTSWPTRSATTDRPVGPAGSIGAMLRGLLLTESLRVGAELVVDDLRVTRLVRRDVSDSVVESQPDMWTFLEYEAPDDRADELAQALSRVLSPDDAGTPTSRSGTTTSSSSPIRVFS